MLMHQNSIHSLLLVLLLIACGLASLPSYAQNNNPPDHNDQTLLVIGNQTFRIHIVQKGETLYAISKTYGVNIAQIALHNPDIYYGIIEGQLLKIPIQPNLNANTQTPKDDYRLHVVQEGDNLYKLARQYGINVESIRKANLMTSDTLRLNATIRIPFENIVPTTQNAGEHIAYLVQKGDGLYSIAKKHNITQEAILEANPEIATRGLQANMLISIPTAPSQPPDTTLPNDLLPQTKAATYTLIIAKTACDTQNPFPKWKPINVALILPFSLNSTKGKLPDNNHATPDRPANSNVKGDPRFIEFYQGFLLAIEQFQLQGQKLNISVFDSQRDPKVVEQIVESDTLRNANLIIGPVYPKNVSLVGNYAAQRRITFVSPLSGQTPAFDTNPYLFQANPSQLTQLRKFISTIDPKRQQHIIIIREQSIEDNDLANNVQLMLQSHLAQYPDCDATRLSTLTYPKGEPAANQTHKLQKLIANDPNCVIIVPSNNEPFISDLLGQINSITIGQESNIHLLAMPKWLKMNNLEFSQLTNLRVTTYSPFYIDYTSIVVADFLDTYRATFRAEPSQYAFQGYDIASYFITAIRRYNEDFRFCLDEVQPTLLQNRFEFEQSQDFSSYENNGIFLLRFDSKLGIKPVETPTE